MPEGLQIQVGADLSQAEKAFAAFAKDAETAGKRAADGMAKPLANIPPAVNKATAALNKLPVAANQSTQALTNLGRVVQDAPFGFLGIANNLNPLLESFQRLKATTGTTGGALRALGSSLMGAGGLGFALSAVSTLLLVFGGNLFGTGKAAKQSSEDMYEFEKAQKRLREEMDAAAKTVVSQATQFSDLGVILTDITDKYIFLTEAVVKQGLAQALFSRKSKLLEDALSKSIEGRLKLQQGSVQSIEMWTQEVDKANRKPLRMATDEEFARANPSKLLKDLLDINKLARDLGLSFDDLIKKSPGLKKEVDFTPTFKTRFNIKDLLKFSFSNVEADIQGIKFSKLPQTDLEKLREQLQNSIKGITPSIQIEIKVRQDALDAVKKQFESFASSINNIFAGVAVDSLANIGELIGQALTGGNLGNVFQGFAEIVGGGLQQIGKQLIQIGVLAKLSQKALAQLFFNPGLAIATGIALSAAGAALKSAFKGGIKGFAQGGLVFGPTVGMVGEGFNTRRSNPEVIAPLDKLRSMIGEGGGSAVRVVVTGRLRGNDMALMNARTSRKNGRLGG